MQAGKVYLVGTGPGDPLLATTRALELIASADAILYDRLIPMSLLAGAQPDAQLEYAGKEHSGDSGKQAAIDSRLIDLAREGKDVVRLKGGDPLVFGRGGEEAALLAEAGIDFEIVPGVTAAVGASAYAGIPLTHRDHASAVAFVTGHEDPSKPASSIDWDALAAFPGTLAFYMGVNHLAENCDRLIAGGKDPQTPAAVIAQGTTPAQRTVTGTLGEIAALAKQAAIRPPALTVIGSVVEERSRIAWFEDRPLLGRRVAVTRSRTQASELSARLRALGADVIETPAIATRALVGAPVDAAIVRLGEFDLIAFTSVPGVENFFAALDAAGLDTRALGGIAVGAVGAATAEALAARGIKADHVPARQASEGLLELLGTGNGASALLAQAREPRALLASGLRERGWDVTELAVYETIVAPLSEDQLAQLEQAELITFASGSAVAALAKAFGDVGALKTKQLISIGPTTSAALREHGLEPAAEAERHDIDGLVSALLAVSLGE